MKTSRHKVIYVYVNKDDSTVGHAAHVRCRMPVMTFGVSSSRTHMVSNMALTSSRWGGRFGHMSAKK